MAFQIIQNNGRMRIVWMEYRAYILPQEHIKGHIISKSEICWWNMFDPTLKTKAKKHFAIAQLYMSIVNWISELKSLFV